MDLRMYFRNQRLIQGARQSSLEECEAGEYCLDRQSPENERKEQGGRSGPGLIYREPWRCLGADGCGSGIQSFLWSDCCTATNNKPTIDNQDWLRQPPNFQNSTPSPQMPEYAIQYVPKKQAGRSPDDPRMLTSTDRRILEAEMGIIRHIPRIMSRTPMMSKRSVH